MLPLPTHVLKEMALMASMPRPPKRSKPGKGRLRIADNSSLRKLMRAARRGMVPDERARTIGGAMMTSERGKAHRWQRIEAAVS